jgi:MFS family permease
MVLVAFVAGYGAAQITHTLTFARKSLGLSEGGMFWVFGITRAASLLGLIFAMVADRRGRRTPFLVAFTLLPLGNLATALLPGQIMFTLSQSVTRMAVIAVAALAVVILAEELSPQVRALGIGIYALAGAMGTGLGLILLPIAERTEDSYRLLFGLTAVGFLALPLLMRFLKESRAYVQYAKAVTFRKALAAGLGRHFWPLAGMAFFIAAFSSPAFDFVLERLIDDLSWETAPARFLLIVFSGIGSAGLVIGGRLADSIGRRRTSVAAMALGLIGGVAFYTQSSGWVLAPAILVASLGATMLTPAFAAHRSELFPTRIRATAAGWVTNVAILGSITGFTIGALLVDEIGLSATISFLGAGVVVAMFLVLRLPETRGMDLVRRKEGRAAARPRESQPVPASRPQPPTTRRQDPTL